MDNSKNKKFKDPVIRMEFIWRKLKQVQDRMDLVLEIRKLIEKNQNALSTIENDQLTQKLISDNQTIKTLIESIRKIQSSLWIIPKKLTLSATFEQKDILSTKIYQIENCFRVTKEAIFEIEKNNNKSIINKNPSLKFIESNTENIMDYLNSNREIESFLGAYKSKNARKLGLQIKSIEAYSYCMNKGREVPVIILAEFAEWIRTESERYHRKISPKNKIKLSRIQSLRLWLECFDQKKKPSKEIQLNMENYVKKHIENYNTQHRPGINYKLCKDLDIYRVINEKIGPPDFLSLTKAFEFYADRSVRKEFEICGKKKEFSAEAIKKAFDRIDDEIRIYGNYYEDFKSWENLLKD